jgi:ribonuclease R
MAKPRKSANRPASKGIKGPPRGGGLPTRDEILTFLESAQGKVGKREIAKAFGIKGGDKIGLKALLAEMADDGLLVGNRKAMKRHGQVPPVAVLEIVDRDDEGELVAEPVAWEEDAGPRPRILVLSPKGRHRDADEAIGKGDRILARVERLETADVFGYTHEAEPIKKLPRERR